MNRVTVIGTKGDQPRHLRDRLGYAVDLVCMEADKLHRSSVPRNSDYVILWSKFLPHRHRKWSYRYWDLTGCWNSSADSMS